jgi:muconolactone D-isomerase
MVAEKFLVLWRLELGRLSPDAARAVMRMQEYGARLENEGKVLNRYHMVGSHGGAWIYVADSHEELDQQLAMAPVYNFATYQVFPLAEMTDEPTVLRSEP